MVFSSFFQATRVRFVFDNEALVCPLNFAKYLFIAISYLEPGNIVLFSFHLVKHFYPSLCKSSLDSRMTKSVLCSVILGGKSRRSA